jgi:NAD(P)-dependent dehydrogenase (short-subunit alcohol dehydrogenase family)
VAGHLEGRSAIVTGSGRGIGRAVALALASEGARLVVNDRGVGADGSGQSSGPAAEVSEEIIKLGGTAIPNDDDVSNFTSAGNIVEQCLDSFGSVDIIFQPAGILRFGTVYELSEQDWDAVVGIHLKGQFNMIRHASPHMITRGWGRIVNVTSSFVTPETVSYAAAKHGVLGLTASAAAALGPFGLTVNAIAPQAETRLVQSVRDEARRAIAAKGYSAMADSFNYKPDPPEYIGPMVAFLCTEAAAGINGQFFLTTGGHFGLQEIEWALTREIVKEGRWTVDELIEEVPRSLLVASGSS